MQIFIKYQNNNCGRIVKMKNIIGKLFVFFAIVILMLQILAVPSTTNATENSLTERYNSFVPGTVWNDTDGDFIQAHGGGIMKVGDTYYWYGEDKTNGYLPATGVHAYSSKDLYNWKDEGVVMRAVENREDLDNDPYFSELYKNRTSEEKDIIFSDINAERGVLERPKVIYNEKTDKYVLWLHVDGPYEGSDSNYAKAKAGVAISDSPTGPFEYIESNRLNKMPEGYEYRVRNTGMSRDMTLFKDDDGTAYIIYASEENYSLYISKLNEDYTAISGEEYGVDFIRALYDQHREAPAMFKYDGKYYLITSGATGWDPNPARYHVADSVLGEWIDMGNPVEGEGASTTHRSQSTHVIPVDPENGEFIYMGDRWNRDDLKNSRYIWLPLEFNQDGEMSLKWYDEWQLEDLEYMGKIEVLTQIPEATVMGEIPELPEELEIISKGENKLVPVKWDLNQESFLKPGIATITGTLTNLNNRELLYDIYVIPQNVKYFINPSEKNLQDYQDMTSYMTDTLINTNINDQEYNPANGNTWGYSGGDTLISNGDDIFSSLRYVVKDSEQKDFSYIFEIENGNYTIYTGFYDPWAVWANGNRKADVFVNNTLVDFEYTYSDAYDVRAYEDIEVNNGKIELKIQPSASVVNKEDSDSQVSWIMIVENEPEQPIVDMTELLELIRTAKDISNKDGKYTERSFTELQKAIQEAENVIDYIETTDELGLAIKQLQSALNGLVLIEEFVVSDMIKALEDFKGDISADIYRLIDMHLISVDHFEKKQDASKVLKHMESFKLLLDHQMDHGLISVELYEVLKADTKSIIRKWQ